MRVTPVVGALPPANKLSRRRNASRLWYRTLCQQLRQAGFTTPEPHQQSHDTDWRIIPRAVSARRVFTMAAMMPSSATSSNPYDHDAVERDLIDPDDGALQCSCLQATWRLGD